MTISYRFIVLLAVLVLGFFIMLAVSGLPAAIIFAILWFEKVKLGVFQGMLAEMGIEFATMPMVFIGILYGPVTGFIIGFFGMPLLDSIRWFVSPSKYGGWPPTVPGPDSFVDGLTAAVAGFLVQILPLSIALPLAIIAKNIIAPIKDTITYGKPPNPTLIINILFNFLLAGLLSFILQL